MMGKKILTMVIVMVLVLGTFTPAFGDSVTATKVETKVDANDVSAEAQKDAKVTKDEAKKIAMKVLEEYFDLKMDEKKFQTRIEFRQDYEGEGYQWNLSWDANDNEKSINARVMVDADTGKVINVYKNEYLHGQERPAMVTITKEQAQKIGEEFLEKINPDALKEAKLKKDSYRPKGYHPIRYNFRYTRTINGLDFDRNYIMVEVDGVKGTVASYNCRWDEGINVPSSDGVLSKEEAEKIFNKETKMNLSYRPYRGDDFGYDRAVKNVKLVYEVDFSKGAMIDAKTGKMLNYSGKENAEEKVKDITAGQKNKIYNKAVPVKGLDVEMDRDQALEKMKDYIKEIMGEGYETEYIRYMENDNYWETSGKKAWSAQFSKEDGGRNGGNISINALTGELISIRSHFWDGKEDEKFEPKLTWEKAYDEAIDTIEKYFPDKIKDIKTEQTYVKYPRVVNGKEIPERYYYFNFQRMVSGILYSEDNITIEFDVKTGEIRQIRSMWNDDVKFPSSKGSISKSEAQKIFLEAYGPKLVYTKFNESNDYKKPQWKMKLVYQLGNKGSYYPIGTIDGYTGKFLDYNGEEIDDTQDQFKETIKGHWAEKELNILANQGIIDPKDFQMDKEITRMEAVKILVNAKGYNNYMIREAEALNFSNYAKGDTNYKYLQMAVRYGMFENKEMAFKPDEMVTREEVAEMIIKLLQYDRVAKAKNIFVLPFTDKDQVSEERVGYVALCKGLGIIEDSDGKFRPQDHMTMVEMAVAVYNGLGNLK